MKLFEITNGWMGNGYVRLLCIAESEKEALKLALSEFKKGGEKRDKPDSYWLGLGANMLCEDVSRQWCGEIVDG